MFPIKALSLLIFSTHKSEYSVSLLFKVVFLPEAFDYICENKEQSLFQAHTVDGPIIKSLSLLAKELDVWLSLGGFHEKVSLHYKSDWQRMHAQHVRDIVCQDIQGWITNLRAP